MDNTKFENLKMNLLFLSIPISGLAALLRYRDFYKALEFALLLFIVCIMTILYIYIVHERKKMTSLSYISVLGYVLITSSAVISDFKYINFLFLFGISLLAIHSEIDFSLLSLLSYAFLMTLLGIGTQEYTVMSLLSAVFIIILSKFFYDFTSLIYVITTILSLNIVSLLILNNFNLVVISDKTKLLDIGIVIVSVVFAYLLFKKKKDVFNEVAEVTVSEEKGKVLVVENEKKEEEVLFKNDDEVKKNTSTEHLLSIEKSTTQSLEEEKVEKNESIIDIKVEKPDYKVLMTDETFLYVLVKSKPDIYNSSKKRAKLCSEIAEMIGADSDLAAAGAFFSDCGKLNTTNYIKDSLNMIKQYKLPNELLQIVKEHHFKFGNPSSKEAAIVMILFRLESSIDFFEQKGKKFPVSHVINNVTDSLLMSGKFDKSGLGIHDYKFIKDYLNEEVPKEYDYFN